MIKDAKMLVKAIEDAVQKFIHYGCPCCIYSTWNKNEDYEGEALQNVKDRLRSFHDTSDMDGKIKERLN